MPEVFYAFKYHNHPELAEPLAREMFAILHSTGALDDGVDVIAPVPLHTWRRLARGYNQSHLLGREVARLARIAYSPDLLVRVRHTPRQALLPPERRVRNVQGAFEVASRDEVRGRRIGLLDDMLTSGSTVNECARMLAQAGAISIRVLALARA
jgi:competence protein ComFC